MARVMGVRQRFVKAAMNAPFLGREEEHLLAVRWKSEGDQDALHRLASAHIRLVIAIAARFRHYGLPMADLIQEGHVGLLEAAARFEPERDVRFSTYATWWIRAAIQDYVLRNWSIVRGGTSSAQKALFFNLRRLRAKFAQRGDDARPRQLYQSIADAHRRLGERRRDDGRPAVRPGHVAQRPDVRPRQRFGLRAPGLPRRDGPAAGRAGGRGDRPRPPPQLAAAALAVLSSAKCESCASGGWSTMPRRWRRWARALGISKERVRQIETRAIEKLRQALDAQQPDARAALI